MDPRSHNTFQNSSQNVFLTIAITTYNRKEDLEQLISNIQDNLFKYNYEILIGNDYQGELIEFNDRNIRVYNHKINLGEYENICFLLKKSKGEYITFQFDDDRYSPKFFEKIEFILLKKPDYIFSDFDYYYDNLLAPIVENYKIHEYSGKEFKRKFFLRSHKTMGFTGIFKKEVLLNNGSIPKFCNNSFAVLSEYGLILNINDSNQIIFIDEKLIFNKIHGGSFSVKSNDFESFYEASINLLNSFENIYLNKKDYFLIKKYFHRAILKTLVQKARIKDFPKIVSLININNRFYTFLLAFYLFTFYFTVNFILLFFSYKCLHSLRTNSFFSKIFKPSF
jgi:hypothetical protein